MVLQLVLIVVFFAAGYQRATWFRGRYGRTQWGWHPVVWGVVCMVSFGLCLILLAISERKGRSRAKRESQGQPLAPVQNYWGTQAAPASSYRGNPAAPVANYWGHPAAPAAPLPAQDSSMGGP